MTLVSSQEAFEAAFEGTGFAWHGAMEQLLGSEQTVVELNGPGIFGLPACEDSSPQGVTRGPAGSDHALQRHRPSGGLQALRQR